MNLPSLSNCTVAVVGLGYVGLPLAVEFSKQEVCCRTGSLLKRRVVGFDIDNQRLSDLREGIDRTNELTSEELQAVPHLEFTNDPERLVDCDVFIVTVPTPIDSAKRPDLKPLVTASVTVGSALKLRRSNRAAVVIYESTVFPGATQETCVPILEQESGLIFNKDFFCGYSPERINPGDGNRKLTNIIKVTSGSTSESAAWVDSFYASIIEAGTHLAPSLMVAEAAKVIENTQRDLNIALVNELAIIFKLMSIDTLDVLEAAGSKWNFLPFKPGLVGGHCIGVDPYYLTHKAEQLGYHPQLVLAGRRINDGMASWVAELLVLALAQRRESIVGNNVLVLGLTFKENCPDLRNTKVIELIRSLERYGMSVQVVDPLVDQQEASREFDVSVLPTIPFDVRYGAVVAAVAHRQFVNLSSDKWQQLLKPAGVLLDLKGIAPRGFGALRL